MKKKEINQDLFEIACMLNTKKKDLPIVLGASKETIDRWIRRTYGKSFKEVRAKLIKKSQRKPKKGEVSPFQRFMEENSFGDINTLINGGKEK